MATAIVDSLITKFILDPVGYQAGAAAVTRSTNQLHGTLSNIKKDVAGFTPPIVASWAKVKDATSTLGDGFKKAFSSAEQFIKSTTHFVLNLAGAIGAATAGLIALGGYAIKQYADYQQLQLTFQGIFQDGDKAAQMMGALSQYSLKSALDEDGLRQAALALTQAKLSVQEFLPVLEILSAKGGKFNTEGIIEAADVLRRIRGGQIAEGLGPEGLGRFGINREDIEKAGGKFDKNGQFLGTWREALGIIRQIASESQGVLDALQNSDSAKLSNSWEAVQKAIRDAGKTLATLFLRPIERGANFIAYLANSGVFGKIADGFAGLFGFDGNGDSVEYMIATLVATLMEIPNVIKRIGETTSDVITFLWNSSFMGLFTKLLGALEKIPGVGKLISSALSPLAAMEAPWESWAKDYYGVNAINANRDSLLAGSHKAQQTGSGPITFPETGDDGTDDTSQVAQNTAKLVELQERQVQISEQMLGGGAVGRGAAASANLSKVLNSPTSGGHSYLNQAVDMIAKGVMEEIVKQIGIAGERRGFGTQR